MYFVYIYVAKTVFAMQFHDLFMTFDFMKEIQIEFEIFDYRVTRGMLHDDRIVFGLLLSKIYLRGKMDLDQEFNYLLRSNADLENNAKGTIEDLKDKFAYFKHLNSSTLNSAEFASWINANAPEDQVPKLWQDEVSAKETQAMRELLLIKSFRADRLVQASNRLVTNVLGSGFNADKELDLAQIVEHELSANTPVLMCSIAGFDASGRVDDLAAELGKQMTSIAIGSEEGFAQADKAINTASKNGRWVLLKNVHLAPSWLVTLEKKLHSLQVHNSFRYFFRQIEVENSKIVLNHCNFADFLAL